MNKDLLRQRIDELKRGIELYASELNKTIGRLQESELNLQYILDKEKQEEEKLNKNKDE